MAEMVADQVADAVILSDYISEHTTVKRGRGSQHQAFCPFHDNTNTPAMSINDEKGLWHCFAGCGGGNVFTFWKMINGYSADDKEAFKLALTDLGSRTGIEIPVMEDKGVSRRRMIDFIAGVQKVAEEHLLGDTQAAATARQYLASRKFTPELVKEWGIGFLPPNNVECVKLMMGDSKDYEAALETRLVGRSDNGGNYWTMLRGRLIVPIKNSRGDVVGFGARIIDGIDHAGNGKWINPENSPVYNKSEIMFGEHLLGREPEHITVVEGYFDVIAMHQAKLAGGPLGLAPCGTSVTTEQGSMLAKKASKITFLFDGDDAGISAVARHLWVTNMTNIPVNAALIDGGDDPASVIIEQNDMRKIASLVKGARDIVFSATRAQHRKLGDADFVRWVRESLAEANRTDIRDAIVRNAAELLNRTQSEMGRELMSVDAPSKKKHESVESDSEDLRVSGQMEDFVSWLVKCDSDTLKSLMVMIEDNYVAQDRFLSWLPVMSDVDRDVVSMLLFGRQPAHISTNMAQEAAARCMSAEGNLKTVLRALILNSTGAVCGAYQAVFDVPTRGRISDKTKKPENHLDILSWIMDIAAHSIAADRSLDEQQVA